MDNIENCVIFLNACVIYAVPDASFVPQFFEPGEFDTPFMTFPPYMYDGAAFPGPLPLEPDQTTLRDYVKKQM